MQEGIKHKKKGLLAQFNPGFPILHIKNKKYTYIPI